MNPIADPQSDGQLICEIKRHPIGIVGLYVAVGFLTIVLAVVIFVVAPNILTNFTRGQVLSIGALVFAAAALVAAGFVFVAHTVYWGNKWIVSTNSITQIKRISLFDKQTSQLSLANLEDITAEQDGLLAQMFHYGVISAETAAATDKFTFIYCPNPSRYVQQILAARERFEQSRLPSQNDQNQGPTAQANPPAVSAPPPASTPADSFSDSLTNASQGGINPEQ